MRAIREALNWSGRTRTGPTTAAAISSRAELSQMEDEQITRIKKEGRKEGRRKGGLSGINGGSIAQIADSLNAAGRGQNQDIAGHV